MNKRWFYFIALGVSLFYLTVSVSASNGTRTAEEGQRVELALAGQGKADLANTALVLEAPVSLGLDDGSEENSIGLTGGGSFLWLNRFTPNTNLFPFYLEEIQVLFPASTGVNVGELIDLYVYEDDNSNPSGATLLAAYHNRPVQAADGIIWSAYQLTPPILLDDAGDVLLAVVNRTAGVNAGEYPAALDETASQGRSWLATYNGPPPTNPEFPAPELWGTIDSYGYPGNWLIRGYGTTATNLPPAHDIITDPRIISEVPYQDGGNTIAATTSPNDPIFSCGSMNQGSHSVWYRFRTGTDMVLSADTYGSNYDTMLAIWKGTLANLTPVACNDDSGPNESSLQSEVKFEAEKDVFYYIEIASYANGPGGNLVFNLLPADRWEFSGPTHISPSINEITINPQNPTVLYAATDEGVYKSSDSGLSWKALLDGLGTYGGLRVTNVVVDWAHPAILYISTWGGGVYKSLNGGNDWQLIWDLGNEALLQVEGFDQVQAGGPANINPYPDQTSAMDDKAAILSTQQPRAAFPLSTGNIASNPPDPIDWTPAYYLQMHPDMDTRLIVTVVGVGAYITNDSGETWSPLSFPGATSASGRAITFAPSNPNIAYLSLGDSSNGGIFRSNNGGLSWSLVAGNNDVSSVITHFSVHPTNPNHVLAATAGQGMMVTTDGGNNWTPSNSGMSDSFVYNIEFAPNNPSVVYATGEVWIWVSNNGGASWTIADNSYPDFRTFGLAVDPTNSSIAYAGAQQFYISSNYFGGGVYKTVNGGDTFVRQTEGMDHTYVLDIEPDPFNPRLVYAGTWASGFFRSTDRGMTWSQGNSGLTLPYIYTIEALPSPGGTVLYAGTFYSDAGLFVSYDQGSNWSALPFTDLPILARNIFDIESGNQTSSNLVIATADGIYTSINSGQNWTRATLSGVGLTSNIILDIEPVIGIPGRFLAATYGDGIYYSNDAGLTWTRANGEPSIYVFGLSASPDQASQIYAATAGLAKSMDGGLTWVEVADEDFEGLFFRTVDHGPVGTGTVYAGSVGEGIWASAGFNDAWYSFSPNLAATRVRTINANFSYPFRVFAGTDGQSAWYFTPFRLWPNALFLPIALQSD
jgi:photosystem II stability/assembly factor-like uncharacterized protein